MAAGSRLGSSQSRFNWGVAAAALLAAWLLTRATSNQGRKRSAAARPSTLTLLLASQGVLVGLLTGIAGVGGGFAIVPALVLLAGLPMAQASGTSLLLITGNGLVALAALGHWPAHHLPLLLPLLLGGTIGAAVGQGLAPHLPDQQMRQGFAALLVSSALLTGVEASHRHSQRQRAIAPSPPTRSQPFASAHLR